ncbi:PepSY domain-containing protein [Flaviflagellibacter deserti]|uniref:PepSY domain-containing protein n=1 Tax=Flaviflagellibacter deserti TaxID=2267266 RepID=A0ABV9Z112_9HYPH
MIARVSLTALFVATELFALPAAAQSYPPMGCLTRREAIAAVAAGRAMPLRQVRGTAETAAKGEMINADLCAKDGQLLYIITVLSQSGKVVYATLDAANGRVVNLK